MFYGPLVHGSEPENDTRAAATMTIIAVDGIIIYSIMVLFVGYDDSNRILWTATATIVRLATTTT